MTRVKVHDWGGGTYWHGGDYDPGAEEAALDLRHPDPDPAQTAGLPVLVKTWPWSGSGQMHFKTFGYSNGTDCTGFYVELRDAGDNYLGRLTYVHLENMQPQYDTWVSQPGTWTLRYLGDVAEEQPDCDWDGPHLHQGQGLPEPPEGGRIQHNSGIPVGGIIDPTNDPQNNWMHRALLIQSADWNGDGCTDQEELPGAPPPKPGSTGAYDPYDFWDFYDVPVGASSDPQPNGPRNRAIGIGDVLAVLFYGGASNGGPPNGNGVDYDSLKDGDWNGDFVVNGWDKVGLRYDRSPSAPPNPPHEAGPPNGGVDISDVLGALAQVGLDCSGGAASSRQGGSPGGAPSSAANAMAVEAVPRGDIDSDRTVKGPAPFDIDIVIKAAGEPYAGYQFALSYDDRVLALVPTVDVDGDTALDSWAYRSIGSETLEARVSLRDLDGDTALDWAMGGSVLISGTTSDTGPVATVRFRCVGDGSSPFHLVAAGERPFGTTTLAKGGAVIDTALTDASVTCEGVE